MRVMIDTNILISSCIPEIRDQKDLPILASAILGDVDTMVTGDKDFFALDIEKPEIVSAKDFIDKY